MLKPVFDVNICHLVIIR